MVTCLLGLLVACQGAGGANAPQPAPQAASQPAPQPAPSAPAKPRPAAASPPGRIVAIGDLHADLPAALEVLRLAGLVDADGHWSGGTTTLVQTGDTTDRGPDSKEVLELMMQLQTEAAAAGGTVHALLGNHEVMNLTGDWRYVSPDDIADFGSPEARRAALSPDGPLGAWLLERDAVVQVGDIVFVHGGVGSTWAEHGAAGLSDLVRAALTGKASPEVLGSEGPLWNRVYLQADEPLACAELGRALQTLGARRMVVGHTTQRDGRIASRCGGQVLGIDTGISRHYGGNHAAVEFLDGDARAIYAQGKVDLPDP